MDEEQWARLDLNARINIALLVLDKLVKSSQDHAILNQVAEVITELRDRQDKIHNAAYGLMQLTRI